MRPKLEIRVNAMCATAPYDREELQARTPGQAKTAEGWPAMARPAMDGPAKAPAANFDVNLRPERRRDFPDAGLTVIFDHYQADADSHSPTVELCRGHATVMLPGDPVATASRAVAGGASPGWPVDSGV